MVKTSEMTRGKGQPNPNPETCVLWYHISFVKRLWTNNGFVLRAFFFVFVFFVFSAIFFIQCDFLYQRSRFRPWIVPVWLCLCTRCGLCVSRSSGLFIFFFFFCCSFFSAISFHRLTLARVKLRPGGWCERVNEPQIVQNLLFHRFLKYILWKNTAVNLKEFLIRNSGYHGIYHFQKNFTTHEYVICKHCRSGELSLSLLILSYFSCQTNLFDQM